MWPVAHRPLFEEDTTQSSWRFRLQAPPPGYALVAADANGTLTHITVFSASSITLRYRKFFRVDISSHVIDTICIVPSSDPGSDFHLSVKVDWRVTDPAAVVRHGITNGVVPVRAALDRLLRPMNHVYSLDDTRTFDHDLMTLQGEHDLPEGILASLTIRRLPARGELRHSNEAEIDHHYFELQRQNSDLSKILEKMRRLGESEAEHIADQSEILRTLLELGRLDVPAALPNLDRSFGSGADPGQPRSLTAECPARARVGDRIHLIVRIVRRPPETASTAVTVLRRFAVPPEGARVRLLVQAGDGLSPLEPLDHELLVPPDDDSDPAAFSFEAVRPGLQRIKVLAYVGGSFVGEVSAEVSAEVDAPRSPSVVRETRLNNLAAVPGEVTLQVRRAGDQYMFQLLSERTFYDPITESLAGEPAGAVERTLALLQAQAADLGAGPVAELRIREAGVNLWDQMVPRLIKDQFWEAHSDIGAFSIATDQDIVPWELLYPRAPGRDAGFLVEQFPVTRRVYGQRRVASIGLKPASFVIPPGSPPSAYKEIEGVNRLLRQNGGDGEVLTKTDRLHALINTGQIGLIHFACHNSFDASTGQALLSMADGDFEPLMLSSAANTGVLAGTAPLVFFNACRSAGVAYEYTQLMGWVRQFMKAGAGAFLGTLWQVPSEPACRFAEAFYDACLVEGEPLGQAVCSARRAIRDEGDPTWLAYTVYGNPATLVS